MMMIMEVVAVMFSSTKDLLSLFAGYCTQKVRSLTLNDTNSSNDDDDDVVVVGCDLPVRVVKIANIESTLSFFLLSNLLTTHPRRIIECPSKVWIQQQTIVTTTTNTAGIDIDEVKSLVAKAETFSERHFCCLLS